MLLTALPHPPATSPDWVLALVIIVCSTLSGLVGFFIVRTLKNVEDAIQAGKAETAALRTELATVKSDLKDYANQAKQQGEELTGLKKAYAALERAFNAMDKWLYGQHVLGKMPQPPDFRAAGTPTSE